MYVIMLRRPAFAFNLAVALSTDALLSIEDAHFYNPFGDLEILILHLLSIKINRIDIMRSKNKLFISLRTRIFSKNLTIASSYIASAIHCMRIKPWAQFIFKIKR